ncbi:MAG: HigA family addiction module antidote protein [Treponema sp.]|jgi:addiction module HigA family antidote|nr:HigA family addiction module antidote protein [Treponema sp.]
MAKQTVLIPGAILKEQFLDKYGINVSKLSADIGLSPSAIRQIISGKLKISLEIALKLEKYFDKSVKYWIDLQNAYSLADLAKDSKIQNELKKIPKAQKVQIPKKTEAKASAKKGPAVKGAKKAADKKSTARKPAAKKTAKASVVKAGRKPKAKVAETSAN